MKTNMPVVAVSAILLGMAGLVFAQDKSPAQKPAAKPAVAQKAQPAAVKTNVVAKAKLPVIGFLEGGGKIIIIKSGPKGPVYSVKDSEGKVLFEDLTTEQLRAQAPEVHQFIKSAYAGNTRNVDGVPDASLRMQSLR
jgi:hypothetical protein